MGVTDIAGALHVSVWQMYCLASFVPQRSYDIYC